MAKRLWIEADLYWYEEDIRLERLIGCNINFNLGGYG